METNKGYIVLSVGYEYDDEFYHTGNYGKTYDAPQKAYVNKDRAYEECKKQTFDKLRGEDLSYYGGNGLKGICKKNMIDRFIQVMREEFDLDADDYQLKIPKTATDEQLEKVCECLSLEFFEVVEIEFE